MLPSLVCVFVRARHQCTTTPLPLSSSPSHTLNTQNHPRYRPTPSAYSLYLLPSCVCMFTYIYTVHMRLETICLCVCVSCVQPMLQPLKLPERVSMCTTALPTLHCVYLPLTIHAPLCVRTILCARAQYLGVCVCVCKSVPNNAYRQRRTTTPHVPCVPSHAMCSPPHPPTCLPPPLPYTPTHYMHRGPQACRPSSSTVILCTLHRYLPLHHQRSIHKQLQRVSLRVRVWVHHRSLCMRVSE